MKKRFDNWGFNEKTSSYRELIFWFIRGSFRRIFFQKSSRLVLIGRRVKIINPRNLHVGDDFIIESNVELNCISVEKMVFGNRCTIGRDSIIRPSNIYGGPKGQGIELGNNSNIGPQSYIGCSGKIKIGHNVMMGPRVSLFAENHVFDDSNALIKDQGVEQGQITIEDNCWIASNVIILSNVTIGTGSIVAAGSLVNRNVPPNSIVAGNPAKVIKER